MKLSDWNALSTRTKQVLLMDFHNMTEAEAEAKLRKWGDWKENGPPIQTARNE